MTEHSQMYSGIKRALSEDTYCIAESMPYRFWMEKANGLINYLQGEKKFNSSAELLVACSQWVVWMEQHPLYAEKSFAFQGEITTHDEPRKRVLTKASLLNWLRMSPPTWDQRYPKKGEDWDTVRRVVESWIYEDKFEGVNAGFYNSAVISSDLGLTSRISAEMNANVVSQQKKSTAEMTDEELRKELENRGIPIDLLAIGIAKEVRELEVPEEGYEEE